MSNCEQNKFFGPKKEKNSNRAKQILRQILLPIKNSVVAGRYRYCIANTKNSKSQLCTGS
jgi:hypothetical protein